MDTRYLSVAGFVIAVRFHQPEFEVIKRWFLNAFTPTYQNFFIPSPTKIDFSIDIVWNTHQEIVVREKEKKYFTNFYRYKNQKQIETYYQNSLFQLQIVMHEVLCRLLSKKQGLILHASGILIDNKAYIFSGDSGAGKSTAVKLLKTHYRPLTDDAAIIKKEKDKWYLYQTPFMEKELYEKTQARHPLEKVFFLQQSSKCTFDRIENKDIIFEELIKQLYFMKSNTKKHSVLLSDFITSLDSFYKLRFVKDEGKMLELFQGIQT